MSEMIVFDHKSISCALKEAFVKIIDSPQRINVRLLHQQETISFSSQACAKFYSNGMAVTTENSMLIIPYTSICFVEVSSNIL